MSPFVPQVDGDLTVVLPGETMRAVVIRVVDRNTVIVKIGQPMTKTHNFQLGDLVGCRRTSGLLGESWQAIEVRPALPDLTPAPAPPVKSQPKSARAAKAAKRAG